MRPRAHLLAPVLVLLLSGCVGTGLPVGGVPAPKPNVPRLSSVVAGSVIVSGPVGFCVDTLASRDGESSAFVLMGSCRALGAGIFAPAPRTSAILTASVIAGGAGFAADIEGLASFFAGEAGRAALSRSGDPASVEVLETLGWNDAFLIHAQDSSAADGTGQDVEPDYWRAILGINGQLVTLTALGHRSRPLSAAQKRAVLGAFIVRMREVNNLRTTSPDIVSGVGG